MQLPRIGEEVCLSEHQERHLHCNRPNKPWHMYIESHASARRKQQCSSEVGCLAQFAQLQHSSDTKKLVGMRRRNALARRSVPRWFASRSRVCSAAAAAMGSLVPTPAAAWKACAHSAAAAELGRPPLAHRDCRTLDSGPRTSACAWSRASEGMEGMEG